MIKLSIKNRFTGSIIFEYENEQNTVKKTVEALLKAFKVSDKWIEEADLRNLDLSNIDFSNSKFYNSQFDNSKFDNSKFYNSKFYNSQFYNSKFYNSQFDNSKFYNSKFDNSKFYNSQFDNSKFSNSKFYNSKFYNSQFDNSKFSNSQFDNSQFDNSQFDNSKFDNSKFYNSKFYNSQFDNSKFDNSQFYNSQFDNSQFDNSQFYNSQFDKNSIDILINSGALEPVKFDFFGRMLVLRNEVPALRAKLLAGEVNGTSYNAECCCFIGTIAKERNCPYTQLEGIKPDSSSDTERWFLGIKTGDTPDNSEIVKLTVQWIDEFLMYINPSKKKK